MNAYVQYHIFELPMQARCKHILYYLLYTAKKVIMLNLKSCLLWTFFWYNTEEIEFNRDMKFGAHHIPEVTIGSAHISGCITGNT